MPLPTNQGASDSDYSRTSVTFGPTETRTFTFTAEGVDDDGESVTTGSPLRPREPLSGSVDFEHSSYSVMRVRRRR